MTFDISTISQSLFIDENLMVEETSPNNLFLFLNKKGFILKAINLIELLKMIENIN